MSRTLISKLIPAALALGGLGSAFASLASAQTATTVTELKVQETQLVTGTQPVTRIIIHPGNGPEALVNGPVWSQTPTIREVADAFPKIAAADRGQVVIRCAVTNIGSLLACSTRSESPTGQGFAAAAQRRLIPRFRMLVPTDQSLQVNTLVVDIPFEFTRPGTPRTELTKVEYRATPSYDEVAGALRAAGITPAGAEATLSCTVGVQGSLDRCRTQSQSRPGVGAALSKVAGGFKIGLWSEQGRPTAGYVLSVPVSVG
ncbi:MAG: TonB family protein [Caulobacteraceae bacterium]|nr:TonB family protein [Caulobacteraceae bacterium]